MNPLSSVSNSPPSNFSSAEIRQISSAEGISREIQGKSQPITMNETNNSQSTSHSSTSFSARRHQLTLELNSLLSTAEKISQDFQSEKQSKKSTKFPTAEIPNFPTARQFSSGRSSHLSHLSSSVHLFP